MKNCTDGPRWAVRIPSGREVDVLGADRTTASLGVREAARTGGAVGSGRASRPPSVALAEDAAPGRRSGAALALAAAATSQPIVRLVDGDPVSMLARLPLAPREPRQPIRVRRDAVPLAVCGDASLQLLVGETRTTPRGHGVDATEGADLCQLIRNLYNMSYRKLSSARLGADNTRPPSSPNAPSGTAPPIARTAAAPTALTPLRGRHARLE
jgi:hypothetical protein